MTTNRPNNPVDLAARIANTLEGMLPQLLRLEPSEETCMEFARGMHQLASEVRLASFLSRVTSGSLGLLLMGLAKEFEALARHCTARDLLAVSEVDPASLSGLRGSIADIQVIMAAADAATLRWRDQLTQHEEEAA
jgi:hypothetical protein